MSGTHSSTARMAKFVSGLKSKSDETRIKTAIELQHYVTTELREAPLEEVANFLEAFNVHLFEMVSSSDVSDKKGSILAIMSLVDVDVGQTGQRISRFANYLQTLFSGNDIGVLELTAKAVAYLYVACGNYVTDFVEGLVKRSFEWLQDERHETRRHAAVLLLRELALSAPTFFFLQVQPFLDYIFEAVRDPKPAVRVGAVQAIRVALTITAQRETKELHQPLWHKQCLEEVMIGFLDTVPGTPREKYLPKEDRIHGSILVLNELLRCSNALWERQDLQLRHLTQLEAQQTVRKPLKRSVVRRLRGSSSSVSSVTTSSSPRLQDMTLTSSNAMFDSQFEHCYESRNCREVLLERYNEICSTVLGHKTSRNVHLQSAILVVLPRLAALNVESFTAGFLTSSLQHLLDSIRAREKDRYPLFVCLGFVALAVGSGINKHLDTVLQVCKSCLPNKDVPVKKRNVDPSVCICLALLNRAVGTVIHPEVASMLPQMMSGGLSTSLTLALQDLSAHSPVLKREIADGLLRMLSLILLQTNAPQNAIPSSPDHESSTGIVLALKTLGTFDFEGMGQSLMPFVIHISENYLTHENKDVRMESIPTCLHLLKPMFLRVLQKPKEPGMAHHPHSVFKIVSNVLWVCVTDPDPEVRLCVLTSFDDTFDSHLAQAENFHALRYASSDECTEIREHAVCLLGRLSDRNPSYIHPQLRKTLLKLLDDLDYSGIGRNKHMSARMLGYLIGSSPKFMRQYSETIMSVLLPKLKDPDPNPAVTMCILTAVGDLAQASGGDMKKYLGDLLPLLLEMLADGTSNWKRGVGLVILGQLIENTGYMIHPYTQHPALLDILLSFLKTEQQSNVRRETLRVLGLLGALDPYKHKMNTGLIKIQQDTGVALICITDDKNEDASEMTTSEMLVNLNYSSLEEFYPACAIAVLMKVIKDPNLAQHQNEVVRAVTFIFKSLGVKGVPYLPRVIPSLLHVIRVSDVSVRDYLFKQLSTIIDTVKMHIRNHVEEIVLVLQEFWQVGGRFENTATVISVVESIAKAVGCEFKAHLKDLMPMILKSFTNDTKEKQVTKRLLQALQKFGNTVEEFLHMLLPHIVSLFDGAEVPADVRRTAFYTVEYMSTYLDLSDFIAEIVHPILRTIETIPQMRPLAVELLCSLATQLGRSYSPFVPVVHRVLKKYKITNPKYDILVAKVVKGLTISEEELAIVSVPKVKRETVIEPSMTIKKGTLSVETLQKAWSFKRLVSKDDWLEWLRRLSIELMKASSSPALRACYPVATTYVQLSRDLFNAAFVSCWSELNESLQDDLLQSLRQALTSQDISEITQTLLNLAEFMDHCDKGLLPLELELVGEKAIECRAFAKALHYKEEEFHKGPTSSVLQSLISINTKLGQTEAASGLLEYSRKSDRSDIKVQERWFEKLHDWDKALEAYQCKLRDNPEDSELALGKMRCLEALGEWGELYTYASEQWQHQTSPNEDCKHQMARLSAAASWAMSQWEPLEVYTQTIPQDSQEGAFYRAVVAIHKGQYAQAQDFIQLSRDLLDTELTAMVGESYQRAYSSMVDVQMLAELEEVIQFKLVKERRKAIAQIWWDRLQGNQRIVEDWQKILQVRSLVLSPQEDLRAWLKFASLCRKTDRSALAQKTLVTLMGGVDPAQNQNQIPQGVIPQVTYQYCKYLYTVPGDQAVAFAQMQSFLQQLPPVNHETSQNGSGALRKLVSRVYLKLGMWYQDLHGLSEHSLSSILHYLRRAKETDTNCYKAWHLFACMNFEAMQMYRNNMNNSAAESASDSVSEENQQGGSDHMPTDAAAMEPTMGSHENARLVAEFAIAACHGFTRSIALSSTTNTLQDSLRLLTVCFEYGYMPGVHSALTQNLKAIRIDNWLQVIPQLIARIDTPQPLVNKLIQQLLISIGKQHPQALLYPLTVAAKSSETTRTKAADVILSSMREHSNELVNQAMMISEELIRVAILWHERWYEGLEEASKLYFGDHNIEAMFKILDPLHEQLEKGPVTLKEMSFNQAYGRDLLQAYEWGKDFKRTQNIRDLSQAWDLYYQVFRRILTQLPLLTSLDLRAVSPRLYQCKDLDIAVPGSYSPNSQINRINCIQSNITVLTSKQKPRKLCIRGSDGHDYVFILKGHEDLRQDERVMQLFGLVNTLLVGNPETFRRNLTIQRYAVIPLSTNSGLIGWVPNCDTLHVLIRDWREKKKILLTIEHKIMVRMAPELDKLSLMQKVEVFEHALELTQGDDLARLLWFKSPSSEVWFDRRTNYTRSLAVMSMVGYVLGLGDRHPSNLMLHQLSGKIVHIDFGDCFEVAMARDKFPERIPFRLTRMLINAMEVTGIEGTYRMTCASVMTLLRKNKDSLMAMLEAFIYDPLLNWRLMEKDKKNNKKSLSVLAQGLDYENTATSLGKNMNGTKNEETFVVGSQDLCKSSNHGDQRATEAANRKAVSIVNRVRDKLTGKDFSHDDALDVNRQVELLIAQATSNENLCQCYIGWCPFW